MKNHGNPRIHMEERVEALEVDEGQTKDRNPEEAPAEETRVAQMEGGAREARIEVAARPW